MQSIRQENGIRMDTKDEKVVEMWQRQAITIMTN